MPQPNLNDVHAAIQALNQRHPGWGWHTCDRDPVNGRFWVCPDAGRIWLPGRMTGDEAVPAFLDAAHQLLYGDKMSRENVRPLHRYWACGGQPTGTG